MPGADHGENGKGLLLIDKVPAAVFLTKIHAAAAIASAETG